MYGVLYGVTHTPKVGDMHSGERARQNVVGAFHVRNQMGKLKENVDAYSLTYIHTLYAIHAL